MTKQDYHDVDREAELRAADAGSKEAMYNLGTLAYYDRDATTAMHWHRKAARLGYTKSQYQLGVVLSGLGRLSEAEPWFIAAANSGDAEAMFNLAILNNLEDRPNEATFWRSCSEQAGRDSNNPDIGLPRDVAGSIGKEGLPRETGPV